MVRPAALAGALFGSATLALSPVPVAAQSSASAAIATERAEYREWLLTSPNSPFAVLAHRRIGTGLTLGPPDAELPLEGVGRQSVTERAGVAWLTDGGKDRALPRNRPVPLGKYRLAVAGSPGRSVLVVYRTAPRDPKPPSWFDYSPSHSIVVRLVPAESPKSRRILASDGVEVEATDAGTIAVTLAGTTTALSVLRVPDATGEESDLEVYFRDETNGKGSYPAGRFVSLIPVGGGGYLFDLNRARNPFCAYSTVFACPLPWRGNLLPVAVTAGERYDGGGLELPPPGTP